MSYTLGKTERLKSKKTIDKLFAEGKSIKGYPLKLIWCNTEHENSTVEFGISVPKRTFKLAVTRNLLKRRCREAYRQNKQPILNHASTTGKSYALMVIYIGKEVLEYQVLETKINELINRLIKNDQ